MGIFLNDSENLLIEKRISNLIENQLPSFILEEGLEFSNFIKTYYKWMELHELTVENVTQFEFKFYIENGEDSLLTEDDFVLILESGRNNLSGFIQGEQIVGQESGATATIDRDTFISNDKIYVKDLTRVDFIQNEVIKGQTSRVEANVNSFFKNPIFASRSLLKNIDLNTSTTNFIDILFKTFLHNFDLNIEADKSNVIKHIIEVYRSKGTNVTFDFLFKSLYNEQNLVFYTPKEDIFKLSSGDWTSDSILRIETSNDLTDFEGRLITGVKSLASAVIDRVDRFAIGNLTITELYLKNLSGRFVIGEVVKTNVVDDQFSQGTTYGVLNKVNIISPGTNYSVGDLLTITGGGGLEATARVKEVASGILTDFDILDGGDGYTTDSILTVNNFGTQGSGFAGRINSITNSYTFSFNNDIIFDFAGVRLSASKYGLSGDPNAGHYDRLVDAFGFRKLNSGTISSIKTLVIGSRYQALPEITATDRITVKIPEDSGVLILNLNKDPDSSVFTPSITGSFIPGERIYSITSNGGSKIGTFLGLVYDGEKLDFSPFRMRMKNSEYLGTYGLGSNDLTVNNSSYINPSNPTIYDLLVTEGGKGTGPNQFKIRRGLVANDRNIDIADNLTDIDYISDPISMTADWQRLDFPIESIEKDGNKAIATTLYKHGLTTGINVNVVGSVDNSYNGENQIVVLNDYAFQYEIDENATTPVTGSLFFHEGIYVKFTIPYNHDVSDRFLISTVDFSENDFIVGYNSGAQAYVTNSGSVFSINLDKGENARIVGSAKENDAGAIGEIEITNPGAGYTTNPIVSANLIGDGNAILTANIGTIANTSGKYLDENGFLSYNKKIYDGYYYQDFSYVLKNKIQFAEYEQLLKKLIHPAGTKMFGEYMIPTDDINFSFDNYLTFEDGSGILLENQDVKKIIAESYFEPNHQINYLVRKNVSDYGSGTLVRVQGGNNIISATSTVKKLNDDYDANNSIIIDNEQKFKTSFGELKLEHNYYGKITTDSQNTISLLTLSNPVAYTKQNLFVLENYDNLVMEDGYSLIGLETYFYRESNFNQFKLNDPLYQRLSDGKEYRSIISKITVDQDNNIQLLTHTLNSNTGFDLNTNVYTNNITAGIINYTSNLMFANSYNYPLPKVKNLDYSLRTIKIETEINHNLKNYDTVLIKNSPLYTVFGGQKFRFYDNEYLIENIIDQKTFEISVRFNIDDDIIPDFSTANLYNVLSSDFQNDFEIGDIITLANNDQEVEIASIINSSCVSTKTRVDSEAEGSFNLITENFYNNVPIILEDDTSTVYFSLESLNPSETNYDKKQFESFLILEQTVRGYTTANGLNDGITTLKGINTRFHKDLTVNDIISLSSKDDKIAKIVDIIDFSVIKLENDDSDLLLENSIFDRMITEDTTIQNQELVLSVPLGNGSNNQTFRLQSTRNLDLEEKGDILHLNLPYDGSNNHMHVVSSINDTGELLLEDGIGTQNFLYSGTTSLEGKLLFEPKTPFNDVEITIEIKS